MFIKSEVQKFMNELIDENIPKFAELFKLVLLNK